MKHSRVIQCICLLFAVTNQYTDPDQRRNQERQHRRVLATQQGNKLKEQIFGRGVIRLAVFNADNQQQGNFLSKWEDREKGSISTVVKAYESLFIEYYPNGSSNPPVYPYELPLTLDFISALRQNFKDLKGGNYRLKDNDEQETDMTDKIGFFGLKPTTNDQLQQIKNGRDSWKQKILGIVSKYESMVKQFKQNIENLQTTHPAYNCQKEINQLKTMQENLERYKSYTDIQDPKIKFIPYYLMKKDIEGKQKYVILRNADIGIEQKKVWVELLFFKYEQDTQNLFEQQQGGQDSQQNTQQEFLQILATLITDLERLHPYSDLNCRTFGVLLLNKELIRRNMSASIMEDPNDFDNMLLSQIVEEITKGQQNFQNLIQKGKLHDEDANDYDMIKNFNPIKDLDFLFCENPDDFDAKDVDIPLEHLQSYIEQIKNETDLDKIKKLIAQAVIQNDVYQLILNKFKDSNILIPSQNEQDEQQYTTAAQIIDTEIQNQFECKQNQQSRDLEVVRQIINDLYENLEEEQNSANNRILNSSPKISRPII